MTMLIFIKLTYHAGVVKRALVQILDWLLPRYVRIVFHAASTAVHMAAADLV
jgi:Na+-transporting NADH:ubiquinone oxidoreductase subunit NqrE